MTFPALSYFGGRQHRTDIDGVMHENNHRQLGNYQYAPSHDTLVIQNRTRYPSNWDGTHEPIELDFHVANSLVGRNILQRGSGLIHSSPGANRPDSPCFTERYNTAARALGLSELSASSSEGVTRVSSDEVPKVNKRWLRQRLSRKSSVSLLKSPVLDHFKLDLDDVCRLGGISLLRLPPHYTALPLLIPTCLAATGNYLVRRGRGTAGIFRIPGQSSVVNTLYAYFTSKMQDFEEPEQTIQVTLRANELPTDIHADIHDIASTFKRFLHNLPGGILGSVELFGALKEIQDLTSRQSISHSNHAQPRELFVAQLVALRLLCLVSRTRFALVAAVFGLLAYLKKDHDFPSNVATAHCSDGMNSHALSVVFAPLLLGDLIERIDLHSINASTETRDPATPKRSLFHPWKTPKSSTRIATDGCSPVITASLDKYKIVVEVIEMLVREWEVVVQQIKLIAPNISMTTHGFYHHDQSWASCAASDLAQYDKLWWRRNPRSARSQILKSLSQPVLGHTRGALRESTSSYTCAGYDTAPDITRSISESLQSVGELSAKPQVHTTVAQRLPTLTNSAQSEPNQCLSRIGALDSASHHTEDSNGTMITQPQLHAKADNHTAMASDGTCTQAEQRLVSIDRKLLHRDSLAVSSDWAENRCSKASTPPESIRQRHNTPTESNAIGPSIVRLSPHTPRDEFETGLVRTPRLHLVDVSCTPAQHLNKCGHELATLQSGQLEVSRHPAEKIVSVTPRSSTILRSCHSRGVRAPAYMPKMPTDYALQQLDKSNGEVFQICVKPGHNAHEIGDAEAPISALQSSVVSSVIHLQSAGECVSQTSQNSKDEISTRGSKNILPRYTAGTNTDLMHGLYGQQQTEDWERQTENKHNIALFAQIRKLVAVIETQQEQIVHLRHELDAVRQCREAATNEKLREMETQLKHHRAELEHFKRRWHREVSSDIS